MLSLCLSDYWTSGNKAMLINICYIMLAGFFGMIGVLVGMVAEHAGSQKIHEQEKAMLIAQYELEKTKITTVCELTLADREKKSGETIRRLRKELDEHTKP